jgi:predicted anti-sigma-YlaC factor YlaD
VSGCGEFELLMMRELDGEITPAEKARLDAHLRTCAKCAAAYRQYGKLVAATAEVGMKEVAKEEWDLYWANVYNRIERGAAWMLVSVGAAAVFAYAAYRIVMWLLGTSAVAWWAKAGIFALALGIAWLFASVAREKWAMRRTDKYLGVKR